MDQSKNDLPTKSDSTMQARAIWTVGSANMATTAGEDMTAVGGDVVLLLGVLSWAGWELGCCCG